MNVLTSHDPLPLDLGQRLKEARLAIEYSVEELADSGEVTDEEQESFEAGLTEPTTRYLRNITRTGIDVMYVLHGISTEASAADSSDWRVVHGVFEEFERFSSSNHGHPRQLRRLLVEKAYYNLMAAKSKSLTEGADANPALDLMAAFQQAWNDISKRFS